MMQRVRQMLKGTIGELSTLITGNALAQAIALVAYFILTRIYAPEDISLYNIFYSYIDVLVILSTCRLEQATVVADNDREAASVARLALRINAMLSVLLVLAILAMCLSGWLPGTLAQLGWIAMLIPPVVFFSGTSRVYSDLFNRIHRYGQISLSSMVNSGSGAVGKILLGLVGMHNVGMPLGTVVGQAAANINYRLSLHQTGLLSTNKHSGKRQRCALLRKYRRYPQYVTTKEFVSSFSANLPFLWLAAWFDRAEVGLFALALTFTFQPTNLVSSAFERVLFARSSERVNRHESLWPMLRRFFLTLCVIALPLGVVAWLIAEPVFTFCFGGRWTGCGIYVQALLPWIVLRFLAMSFTFVSNIFSTQRYELYISLALLLLRVAVIAVGINLGNFLTAIRLFAAVSALASAVQLVWYLWQVHRYETQVIER